MVTMRVLLINAVSGIRSTGRICTDLASMYIKEGHEVYIAYGRACVPNEYKKISIRIGNNIDVYWHALMSRLFDDRGLWSKRATKRFIRWANLYDPDIVWLHNLHSYYINYEILFDWIKSRPTMKVKWTQHDCWAFTGGCTHFSYTKCNEWKNGCNNCPINNTYISSKKNRNYQLKKKAFSEVNDLSIITPSKWLADLVKMSFLSQYKITVIYNTVDTTVFKPTNSDFRNRFCLQNKFIVLGVASEWTERKGLNDLIELSNILGDDYKVVIVGLNDEQLRNIPHSIIGIRRTNSTKELAGLYSTADVYVNTTYEDTYPTTNLEAQACGTPVITYKTGGSVESVPTKNICPQGDVFELKRMIMCGSYDDALELNNIFNPENLF